MRNFIEAVALWFVVLMALRIVTDLFINMDEFAEQEQPFAGLLADIVSYYGYQSLAYISQLGGVVIVSAAAFTLARMNHTNELTAMLASGVSLYRVILPIVIAAILLTGLIVADQELVIPAVAPKLVRSRDDVHGLSAFSVPLVTDGHQTVWYARSFNPSEGKMTDLTLILRDDQFRQLASIFGHEARPAELAGQAGWLITDAAIARAGRAGASWLETPTTEEIPTSVDPAALAGPPDGRQGVMAVDTRYGMTIRAERVTSSSDGRGGRVAKLIKPSFTFATTDGRTLGVFLARSAGWRRDEHGSGFWRLTDGVLFYPTDLTGEDLILRQSSRWLDYLSTRQLNRLLKLQRVPDPQRARLTKYTRVTDPINNIVMLLLGLPFLLSREQRDVKASASLCVLMMGTFYAFIYVCRYVGLSPIVAAWLPTLIFGPIAAAMLDSIRT